MFNKIIRIVKKIGPYQESPIKDYIMLKHRSTFLTIKPRKKYLDITFFLPDTSIDFPIFNSRRTSRHRVTHVARFESADDISDLVADWISQSYSITGS
ncbi:hypothetical protein DQQ10_08720 [Pseudochryseolinea flava]|uniref:DUF5655 domain-containing protein n=2 Tax=Pseudochryseolinea flava TaxID=2059302 RepID=A0A364Y467_9BACT|nr:hypothetical protein DQQ10_08720 [Pseudochryseolinea flava]